MLPSSIDVTTRRDAGSQVTEDLQAIAITDLQVEASGLVPEDRTALSIVEDTTNTDPYDGNGTHVEMIEVPAGATSLIAKLADPTAPDFDMYVGQGAVSRGERGRHERQCGLRRGGRDREPGAGHLLGAGAELGGLHGRRRRHRRPR